MALRTGITIYLACDRIAENDISYCIAPTGRRTSDVCQAFPCVRRFG